MNSTAAATRFLVGFSAAVALKKEELKKGRGTWTTEKHPSPTHPVRCNFIALPVFGLRYHTTQVMWKENLAGATRECTAAQRQVV